MCKGVITLSIVFSAPKSRSFGSPQMDSGSVTQPLLGWVGFACSLPFHCIPFCRKECFCVQEWEIEGFRIGANYLLLTPLRCPGPSSFGGCTILSGPFAAAVVVSAAEPEEALWRWSHSGAQPTCWNFPEILHCRHFPRRYANGIRKNQLSLRNRGMRRAVNATGWVIGWLLAGDRSASHPYIILMNFYGVPPLLLPPSPPPHPPSWGRRFMACSFSVDWMQLALLQQRTNRYICFTGWEKWVWRNCTATSLCNKGALKNADIFYEMALLSFLAVRNLPIRRKGKKKKKKRLGERNIWLAILQKSDFSFLSQRKLTKAFH